MNYEINIAIAEDHVIVRQGFIRMLSDYPNIKVLFEVGNGKDLLKALQVHKPSIVLIDIAMPIIGGLKSIEKIKERYPKLKIIVISAYGEEMSILEYVKMGANSFLNKECDVESLIHAIQTVYKTGVYFDKQIIKLLEKNGINIAKVNKKRDLTERETIALKLICSDIPYDEIAKKMSINSRTARWYEQQLLRKTNCKSIEELKSYLRENLL